MLALICVHVHQTKMRLEYCEGSQCILPVWCLTANSRIIHNLSGYFVLQLEELQKVKIPTSIKVTPTRGGLLDNWD